MNGSMFDRPIFDEPPDDLGNNEFEFGHLLVYGAGLEAIEVAWAFKAAGDRLLATALDNRESWEAAYPILFCYRHALEVHLKALVPPSGKQHDLETLWKNVRTKLDSRYRADQIRWLGDRLLEFHQIDPRSTAFRYHDAPPRISAAELWVDFRHLKTTLQTIFQALDRIRLDMSLSSREAAT